MKLKLATQVLSRTVAADINVHIALVLISEKATFTVEFLENFNKLFNILNSSTLYARQ